MDIFTLNMNKPENHNLLRGTFAVKQICSGQNWLHLQKHWTVHEDANETHKEGPDTQEVKQIRKSDGKNTDALGQISNASGLQQLTIAWIPTS